PGGGLGAGRVADPLVQRRARRPRPASRGGGRRAGRCGRGRLLLVTSPLPRLLVLMGSGETSPTMVKTHRTLIERVGGGPAVLLDTPFGFQENADDLVARARAFFKESVGTELELATYRSAGELGSVAYERTLSLLRSAGYVFAGPGSPTYALSQWQSSAIPALLRSKLESGGCVTFASAAALTMGVVTVPVYEIYKVGATPTWVPGLDL